LKKWRKMKTSDIDAIVIHCTATKEGKNFRAADIDRWHKAQGWKCIGYHYVIGLDGKVEAGRTMDMEGAHCKEAGMSGKPYNKHSIGIVYVGGLDKNGNPKDTRTDAQKLAMVELVNALLFKFPAIKEIIGHNEVCSKECPCFDVKAEFPQVIVTAEKTR